jgi:Cu/Ag efflux protein CusF
MKYPKLLLLFIAFSSAGCAAYELQPLGANHPASIDATSAAVPKLSKTLDYAKPDIPSPTPIVEAAPAQQDGHGEHHGGAGAQKTVSGDGKVVAAVPSSAQLVVDHGPIPGFMDAMTMGYRVEPPGLLEGLKPGDQVRFTIDVQKKTIVKLETLK